MSEKQDLVSGLTSNVEGLVQLANWQLALTRDMKDKVCRLSCLLDEPVGTPAGPDSQGGRKKNG